MANVDEDAPIATEVSSVRPVMLALAAVLAISVATLLGTLLVSRATTQDMSTIVDNSLRSVQLVGRIREHVGSLSFAPADQRATIIQKIAVEITRYRPLATASDEAKALARFEELLGYVIARDSGPAERAARIEHMRDSLSRLVRINTHVASHTTERIRRVQRTALYAQIVGAILTLVAVGGIAIWLNRIMRRKRELVARALDSLVERNRDLSQFVGRTAHDLRGPLMPIGGYADLLAAGSADVAKAAARIKASSVHMAAIIEDLLVLSTAGHLPPGKVDCEPVIAEVLADLASALGDAKTDVRIEDCSVAVAPSVLRQLLYNVVSNCAKYRASERRLQLDIEVRSTTADRVQIAITDNGIDIAPEALARVFEPHYRAPEAQDRPGSGLGLAIVKRMVSAAGGTCEMTSELGRGTRFVIVLPAAT